MSAATDFAFAIIAEVAGQDVAKAIQLSIEYDPAPPFEAGHPDKASAAATELMTQRKGNPRRHLAGAGQSAVLCRLNVSTSTNSGRLENLVGGLWRNGRTWELCLLVA
ncbi:hypothetical protein CK222_10680 [Mesorhizobium sp. WSM3866]|nr:hypothetical protein CK222_10680 [Mesorhizobium sp. WSM3866]